MNVLITGRPGIGKTTLVRKIAMSFAGRAGGFYTEEIRKNGIRTGFRIKTLDGKTGILSGIDITSPCRVGKYKVDLANFEDVALPAIESAINDSRTVIIDEIGPMELFSAKFKKTVIKALDSPGNVIATIKLKGSGFIDAVKSRADVNIYTIDPDNRNSILEDILEII
ncbi:MAG: NTPase [Candidatus Omnitrophota bacterium]|nr:NTPase [Candidatus Omnitrophota bacterium]